jgi:hypothetical protein
MESKLGLFPQSTSHMRLAQFLEEAALDRRKLQIIIEKHRLTSKAQRFEDKFDKSFLSKQASRNDQTGFTDISGFAQLFREGQNSGEASRP